MDHPGGSELDSSLPQPDNPCLIVEDSQPDSVVALMDQDDPESSYRALLSRRLSSLQPTSHSPVLELISSPAGSRSSQIDSQLERSQSCSQSGPAVAGPTNVGPAREEESQVISICPLPNKKSGAAEYSSMDSRADSTTHCAQSEEGTSQFGFLELSESQGLGGEVEDVPEVKGDVTVPQTDSERHSKPVEQRVGIDASGRRDNKSTRSEVTSSSSSEPLLQSVREMRVQALLHSQGRHTTEDHQDSEVLSSQEDLFDAADKTGAGVDSTMSELHPLTPAHTLSLLHLSGQGTLVQQSLSQCSTDYVAPTQDLLSQTPFIVPNSPTEGGPDEPMDTSLPTGNTSGSSAEGPMETAAVSKPRPTASTPVSQNSPGFVLEKTLSLPSQPEFSHDVFVATQSQEAASSSVATRDAQRTPVMASLRDEKPRSSVESSPSALSLRLTVNTESSALALLASEQSQDDSQATQIEGLDEALGIDTSDSVMMSRCSQRSERNGVFSSPKTAAEPKAVSASDLLKHSGEGAGMDRAPSQRSQVQESTPTARNVTNVNVSQSASGGSPMGSRADKVDALASSRVQRTPPTAVRGSLTSMSQPVFSQMSSRASVNVTGSALNTQSLLKHGPSSSAPSQLLSLDRDVMDEGLGDEAGEEEEEGMMEEGESTLGPETSALGLALSQTQALSPEPMEEMEGREEVSESERSHGLLEKGDALSSSQQRRSGSSQPAGRKVSVSTNGHGSQAQSKEVRVAPNSLSQAERKGPEAKGVKDKSLSDSSGEIPFHFTLPKEGELIGPAVNATPPLINQLKQTPRHSSTPIDKPAAVGHVSVATCDIVTAESSGEDTAEKGDGKLSLRMKLVTPVEEGSSEHFCLQKPTLSDEEGSVVKVTTVAKAVTSPSVFSRVRQVHRQLEVEVEEENQHDVTPSPVGRPSQGVPSSGAKGEGMRTSGKDQGVSSSFMTLCSSFSSQRSSLGCNSLPSSQNDVPASPHQEPSPAPRREPSTSGSQAAAAGGREVRGSLEPSLTPTRTPGPQAAAAGVRSLEPSLTPTRTPGPQAAAAGVRSLKPSLTPTRTPGPQAAAAGVRSPEPSTPTRTPGPQAASAGVRSPETSLTPTRTPGPQATAAGVRSPEPSTPTRTPGPQAAAAGVRSPEPSTPTRTPGPQAGDREVRGSPELSTPTRADVGQRPESHQTSFENSNDTIILSPPSKRQKAASQPPGIDAQGFRSPSSRGEAETPSFRRTGSGPAHRRHVRTIQEVRTTVTRIITDVYYEDGKEVDRKVTEESEEPVVDCHVMDSDVSPCRTVSSLTSGDLADVSSLSSSKTSSLQRSSSGTSTSSTTGGHLRADFAMPSTSRGASRGGRRGGGHQQRGHRGQRARSAVTKDRGFGSPPSRGALVPQTGRGRARRGRPPSRSSPSRGGGTSGMRGVGTPGLPQSSSEDEPYTRLVSPPGLPDSPMDAQLPSQSDSLRSSPEEGGSAGRSSLVGLRVVAKWSSNHYFYSGRITRDVGEGRFRLRFDDGYECEVLGKDILLCDPIPLETEVTALLEGEYFSIGTVKGHKTEDHELFYCVEREGNKQWHNRSTIILSLEQGNKLREQHSLGPYEPSTPLAKASDISLGKYEPSTPLAKASDISLDNLVEGKRRRTGTPGGQSTPNHSSNSSASPRTPGPSGKRKLMSSEDDGRRTTPAKRGRRGPGSRTAQRVGVVNTSDSAPEIPGQSTDLLAQTHGPLPQNTSLFMGFAFMLTASSECDRLSNKLTSDDDEEYVETAPYHRGYTESQLQAGGGFILSDFNEEQCKAAYQSLLIADQHCRTSKYLQCVASGVPCVSHMWVRDCCKDNKLLNYRNYLLPAGVGPDDSIVEWHPRATPFKALRVLLVFEEPVELWLQLLTLSGASSVKHYQADKDAPDIPTGKFDLVITDRACPPSIQKSVMSQKLPLLSAEWLIQSLICGERQGYQSKPQYSHDHLS